MDQDHPHKALEARFKSFAMTQSLKADEADHQWDVLAKLYGEAHRAYHTLDHIGAMLSHFDSVRDQIMDADAFEAAIWYHDAIYNTHATTTRRDFDNEYESADLAERALRNSSLDLYKVRALILVTKDHQKSNNSDEDFMKDIDLSILGQRPEIYQIYQSAIRKEYHYVPTALYCEKRIEILNNFLRRTPIFSTQHFQNRFEEQAERNLGQEIGFLKRQKIRAEQGLKEPKAFL